MNNTNKIPLALYTVLGVFMVSGSSATMSYAATQALPSCTDPTGQNLPCLMVISTLPPPPNSLQCQETSGQILPCSYATQNLSNGEQIVAITVYVPANYVFTGYGPWSAPTMFLYDAEFEQYPSNWKISEENLRSHQVVMFSAPEITQKLTKLSSIIYIPAQLGIAVEPVASKNVTILQYVSQFFNLGYHGVTNYKIVNSSMTLAIRKEGIVPSMSIIKNLNLQLLVQSS